MTFFLELAHRLDGQVELNVLLKDAAVVAFSWALHTPSAYHLLFCGVNYELNRTADLYFNLLYASLDRALRKRSTTIQIGQTADVAKARLGCSAKPLYVFTKGIGPLAWPLVYCGAPLLVARTRPPPRFHIFKVRSAEPFGPDDARMHQGGASAPRGLHDV